MTGVRGPLSNLSYMRISQKTVGLLIDYLDRSSSQSRLGGELKRHNLGDADPGPDNRRFSQMSKARRADLALGAALKSGKEDELVDLAATALRDQDDSASAPDWVRELLKSLRADGFACTATETVVPSTSSWSTSSTAEVRWAITPLGYTGLPVASLASDLADQLNTEGFATAAGHYDQALNAFHAQDWAASNSQLRTTFESVLLELASRRAGITAAGGSRAIDALQANGDLPVGQNEYVRSGS
jgi:DNA-directed RNA polymerase specialized sigma54-like protein